MAEKYSRNPRKRVVRGSSADELRQSGRRRSEELNPDAGDMPFVRLGNSAVGTVQDVVQRVGDAIIGGDFGGNARGSRAVDIQLDRMVDNLSSTPDPAKVASGDGSVAIGRTLKASGFQAVAVGVGAVAAGDYSAGFGHGAANADYSLAIQGVVSPDADYGIAIGDQASVSASGGIAIGGITYAQGVGAIAIGDNEVTATGTMAIAVGSEARADGAHSVAIGVTGGFALDSGGSPVASGARSVALGYGAYTATADQAVIAATTLKMQTARVGATPPAFTYESVITTSSTPTTNRLARWADTDRIEDAGVSVSDLATAGHSHSGMVDVSGTPTAGRVASWTDSNTVQDAGYAASDVARLSIANTFEDDVTVEGDLTVDLDATITGDVLATGIVQAAAAWIPGVAVSLNAKLYCGFNGNEPYETTYTGSSTGHRGQVGTATGGVIYRPGKFGKAVQVAEATTNFFSNPSFETNTSSWPVEASATIARTSADALYGSYCADYARTGSAASSMYNTHTISGATAGRVFTHSGWVKAKTASDVGKTLSILIFEVGGASASAYSSTSVVLTNEWQRITLTRTVVQNDRTSIQSRFQLGSNGNCYVDGAQLEEKAYATPYCDGSLGSGHSWSGTAHASWSSRTAASLYYANPLSMTAGTVSFWWRSSGAAANIPDTYLWSEGNLKCYFRTSDDKIVFTDGTNTIATAAQTFTNQTWMHIACVWSSSGLILYKDGVSAASGGTYTAPTKGTNLYVGSTTGGASQANGLIDDLVVVESALSADRVRSIYESACQLICS